MNADQKVDQVQPGQVLPWTKIFAWTYVLGVFVCGFALLIKSHGDPIFAIMGGLFTPMGFFIMLLEFFENHSLEILCLGILLVMGYWHLFQWLRFENRRRVNLAIVFVVAGGWVWYIIYAATHIEMFF